MAENLGRKGKSVNVVGVFPLTDTSGCIASIASKNEQLRAQLDLCNDDENLIIKIKAFYVASHEKTNNSTQFDDDISEGENTYPDLEEHDLEED
ncbi:hypothetical protein D8674_024702 [Pyrus ussuriensis x Pyrus communis]|uniref:Uncharacterized protein n=1 Tax=Pyrus ussuriensis x Pyrus communis TaxID=2448454 RepID=A0A5N5HAS2_9ROSA|nr:hypothetical protein D8674_024702 [Pyrus ussuriensis x Pyrus communis]